MRPRWPLWRIILISLLIVAVLFVNFYFMTHAKSEEAVWVLCQPDSWVNVRTAPSKHSSEIGRLECGDIAYTDGKIKNGYIHLINLSLEENEGWIKKGYIVYDEPYKPAIYETRVESKGRVAARKTIKGNRRCWLKDGQSIKVYMASAEWCVTNKGFVKTQFIDLGR